MNKFDGRNVAGMTTHWLDTPVMGYLGSSYGQDLKANLQLPQNEAVANDYIRKLQNDVPVLSILPDGAIGLYAVPMGVDGVEVKLIVADQTFELNSDN